jgi:AraC-like DNA-binding protein
LASNGAGRQQVTTIYGSSDAIVLPDMSSLSLLEARLAESQEVKIADLGGVDAILADADQLCAAPILDVLVDLVAAASDAERCRLYDFLAVGFDSARDPQSFRDAIDRLISNTTLRASMAQAVVEILTRRIQQRATEREALIAAYSLEGLFRLSIEGVVSRYRPLLELADVAGDAPGTFARHVAKIGGTAFHLWGGDDLLEMLRRLLANEEAEGEAAFELGLAHLSRALDSIDMPSVLAGLETSRMFFERASQVDAERADARAYLSAIDLVTGFAAEREAQEMQNVLSALMEAGRERAAELSAGNVAAWLAPRLDEDLEWFELARRLRHAVDDLARPSWVYAAASMDQILAIYNARCTIAHGDGLRSILRPRIEASFIRERGLAAHLDDLLEEDFWPDQQRAIAEELRARLEEIHRSGAGPGKVEENGRYPLLARILQDRPALEQLPDEMARPIEQALTDYELRPLAIANPVLQRTLATLRTSLAHCSEYEGTVRHTFDALLQQLLVFCSDRQNADIRDLGSRGQYLRADHPSESDLQIDLREFLVGNLTGADVLPEVRGVATGRTDLRVSFGGPTFIIELKKHDGHFSREAADHYRAQATSYQASNVRLGFLGVLEVVDRAGPVPSLEECFWHSAYIPDGSELVRHLIVFKVPGRLKAPSKLR